MGVPSRFIDDHRNKRMEPTAVQRHVSAFACLLFGGLAIAMSGCKGQSKTTDRDITVIEIEQFVEMIEHQGEWEKKAPTVVVDVRSVTEYNAGHIPGALSIPVAELRADDPVLTEAHNIVVYGSGLMDYLSAAAFKKLVAQGYENVYDFRSGAWMWQRQGRKLVTFGEVGDSP